MFFAIPTSFPEITKLKMASSQTFASTSVGTGTTLRNYTNDDIRGIKLTNLDPNVCSYFDYFIMNDLMKKDWCKRCWWFYAAS